MEDDPELLGLAGTGKHLEGLAGRVLGLVDVGNGLLHEARQVHDFADRQLGLFLVYVNEVRQNDVVWLLQKIKRNVEQTKQAVLRRPDDDFSETAGKVQSGGGVVASLLGEVGAFGRRVGVGARSFVRKCLK